MQAKKCMKNSLLLLGAVSCALCICIGSAACTPSQTDGAYALNDTQLHMVVGESERLELSGEGIIVLEGVEWSSSDTAVATVQNGTVNAVGAGEAVITAAYGGSDYTCSVTVEEIQTIALSDTELFLVEKDTQTISLLRGSAALTEDVSWASSDAAVATVTGGRIECLSAGEVTISATYEGETYECDLTVCPSPVGAYYADITVAEMENAYFEFDLAILEDKTYTYSRRYCASTPDGPMEGGVVNSGSWRFADERTIVFTYAGGEMRMRVREGGTLASVGELPTGGMDAELTFHLTDGEE